MAITAAQLIVKIGADISDAERGLQTVSRRLGEFGKRAATTGGLLSAGVTLPLIGVAKSALDAATDYESALNMMQAVSGATDEQMARVAETAKALGADMTLPATSAGDAARAMTELAKAGLSVNDALAAAKGVLQLAAAGNLSEAAAAETAANALNAFHLSGERATDIANLLAAAANASSGEVTDMADSLKMSAAVFASAGIPIEELVASIGQMANAGIKGSDAGTSLKQMLLSLQAPSGKAAKLMADLGINVYDAQGKMLPFGSVIEQFSRKLGKLSQEQRNAALATIFGSDAVRAANIVLMQGADAHNRMLEAVTRQGAAADLAEARMKGLGGALQGLQSQIETILLEVAEPFLRTLEGLVRWVADLIAKIGNLDPNIRNAALAFAAVLAAAGPVLLIIGALSSAFAFLASPIGLIVLAVAALAAAWATNFGGIRDITAQVFGWIADQVRTVWPSIQATITGIIQTIRDVIVAALTAIQEFWAAHGEEIMTFAKTVWEAIRQFVDLAIRNIADIVTTIMTTLQVFWEENGQQIIEATQIIWNSIWQIISTIMGIIQKFWRDHGEQILHIAQNIWNIIKAVIETVLNTILGLIRLITSIIRGDWEGAWEAIKGIAESIWNGIYAIISNLLDSIKTIIGIALDSIRPLWERVWEGIKATTKSVWDGIVGAVKGSINAIITGINSLIHAWNRIEFRIPGFDVNIPSINIPRIGRIGGGHISWPGIAIGTPDIPTIPLLGAGGIITRPTLALVGEAGPEAVVPLSGSRLDALADRIADAIMRRPTYTINAQYRYQDERSLRDDLRLLQLLGAAT